MLAGDRIELGGVEVRVHHPPVADWQRQKVRNDDSVVFEIRYGQVSVLMTGDISREVEERLLPSLDLLPILDDAERDRVGTEKALEFIKSQPGRFIPLAVNRLGYFFGLEKRVLMYFYGNKDRKSTRLNSSHRT